VGDDEGLEAVGTQVVETLEHGLVDHLGVRPTRGRVTMDLDGPVDPR
jgi:hypothetical protein